MFKKSGTVLTGRRTDIRDYKSGLPYSGWLTYNFYLALQTVSWFCRLRLCRETGPVFGFYIRNLSGYTCNKKHSLLFIWMLSMRKDRAVLRWENKVYLYGHRSADYARGRVWEKVLWIYISWEILQQPLTSSVWMGEFHTKKKDSGSIALKNCFHVCWDAFFLCRILKHKHIVAHIHI